MKRQTWGIHNRSCSNDLGVSDPPVSDHIPADNCKTDPDLDAVIDAWVRLPEAVRAVIVAMVKASSDPD
jgi:hypothetical protein